MYVEEECKINGLQVMEMTYRRIMNDTYVLDITYALAQYDPTGKKLLFTHGKVTANVSNLSIPTKETIVQLVEQIEQDLTSRHFKQEAKETDDETRTTTGSEEVGQI